LGAECPFDKPDDLGVIIHGEEGEEVGIAFA
jgi:hypothetical protein